MCKGWLILNRATRLGELGPIWVVLKITELTQIVRPSVFHVKSFLFEQNMIFLTKSAKEKHKFCSQFAPPTCKAQHPSASASFPSNGRANSTRSNSRLCKEQGCQIVLGTIYQNKKKYTEIPQNLVFPGPML
jgi:hypothetical protein